MKSSPPEVLKIVASSRSLMLGEGLRRWILIIGLFLTVALVNWTDFQPYFAVSPLSKWDKVELFGKGANTDVSDAETSSQSAAAYDQRLIAQGGSSEEKQLLMVAGEDWQNWFAQVEKSLKGGTISPDWYFRICPDEIRDVKKFKEGRTSFEPDIRRLVFKESEMPLSKAFSGKQPGTELYIGLTGQEQYLKVYYARAPELSGLGSGIFGVPEAFSYPLRQWWYYPLIATAVLYLILPWPSFAPNVCAYKRWQVVLCDFAGVLLYGMFMAMPFFIVGGTVQAMTEWILFSAIFWGLAALGLLCIWWSYFYSVYRIYVLDNELVFVCPKAVKAIALSDITAIEAVRIVPPKWLIILSFIAALGGKGGGGRALLLANSSSEGLCLGTRDGIALYVWITNSMGQESLTNLDLLFAKLDKSASEQLPEMREMEAIVPPVIEPYSKRKTSKSIKIEEQESLLERASRLMRQDAEVESEEAKDAGVRKKPEHAIESHKADKAEVVTEARSAALREKKNQAAVKEDIRQVENEKRSAAAVRNKTKAAEKETEKKYTADKNDPSGDFHEHATDEIERNGKKKMLVSPEQVEVLAKLLWESNQNNMISQEEYKSLHAQFQGYDESGDVWTMGLKNRKWHLKEAGKWVIVEDGPDGVYLPVDLVNRLEALQN